MVSEVRAAQAAGKFVGVVTTGHWGDLPAGLFRTGMDVVGIILVAAEDAQVRTERVVASGVYDVVFVSSDIPLGTTVRVFTRHQ